MSLSVHHKDALHHFEELLQILDTLREKCPWDKKQTWESLSILTIEETYELIDALRQKDKEEVAIELGDVLLHLVFYARLGHEEDTFHMGDVIRLLNAKLIRRHPHIYGEVSATTQEEVLANWEAIKLQEKENKVKANKEGVLSGVPKSLPSMVKSYRIQQKVAGVGFDWSAKEPVLEKVQEEFRELREALDAGNVTHTKEEYGDLLFALVNLGRHLNINPEEALHSANSKFQKRFEAMEKILDSRSETAANRTLEEWDLLWETVKQNEKRGGI